MAEPKGILEMVGVESSEEDGADGEGSPKGRAMREMFEAMQAGKWDAAGHAYERAYKICKQGPASSEESTPEESEEADEYEG